MITAAVLALTLTGFDDFPAPKLALHEGHERMVALLAEIAQECRANNVYLGWGPVEKLREELAAYPEEGNPLPRARLLARLGAELLRMGETDGAIDTYETATVEFERAFSGPVAATKAARTEQGEIWLQLGTSYLRLAEDRNCCLKSNRDSCILPIQGGGLHDEPEGSTQAMRCFGEALQRVKPNSQVGRKARWLMNVAAMTLGKYPHEVPEEYRIPPEVFASEELFPRFVDVASEVGLTDLGLAGGLVAEDFDGDGLLDIMTSDSDADGQLRLYFSRAGKGFVDHTEQAGLIGIVGGLNLISADYDNDGDVDVLVLRGAWLRSEGRHPNSLLRNEGDGRFIDVTFAAGLGQSRWPTQTAGFADYDNDGDLDLYVGNESEPGQAAPCELFQNNGDGTFTDVAAAAGVTNDAYTKGVAWGDVDGDGDADLYVSNMAAPNRLYINAGDGTFADVAEKVGVTAPISGFPCWFFDYDNDGALDLFAASYGGQERPPSLADVAGSYMGLQHKGEPFRLYRGDGQGGFTDVSAEAGLDLYTLPMGSNFGDADNDGYLDIYLGTGYPFYEGLMPNVMLRNQQGKGFVDVTTAGGFGHLQKGHGIAFADLDGDGDQDVAARMGGAYPGDGYRCVLFRNPGNGNHWLKLRLVGAASNSFGVGARIRVDLIEGETRRSVHRTVTTGGSFGCNPLRQELGLGRADRIERVEVWWPTSGTHTVYEGVALDTSIELHEGAAEVTVVPVIRVNLGRGAGSLSGASF